MSVTLYWLQAGCCSGDSMSLLNAESPDLVESLELLDVEVLWHPSLSQLPLPEMHRLQPSISSSASTGTSTW